MDVYILNDFYEFQYSMCVKENGITHKSNILKYLSKNHMDSRASLSCKFTSALKTNLVSVAELNFTIVSFLLFFVFLFVFFPIQSDKIR